MLVGPTTPRVPIGVSDFRELRRDGYTYVDKTAFVAGVIDAASKAMLFPRPRRFGKTLNLSTLRYFLERTPEQRADLFEGTWIWNADGGKYRAHFQRYPVIYLTFKDVKALNWRDAWSSLRRLLQVEAKRLWDAHDLGTLFAGDSRVPSRYALLQSPDVESGEMAGMLPELCDWLTRATGERAVILIDEYDGPMHAAWEHDYWTEALDFFRTFLSAGYKDQELLFRGVLTGILKVARESIFSGLNNTDCYSILSAHQATAFGFTEAEVEELTASAGRSGELGLVRRWYNGYRFGGSRPVTIYNPWSILQWLHKAQDGFQSYWKNTSSNALITDLLLRQAAAVGPDIERLLRGETIEKPISEDVPLAHIRDAPNALWGLLTFSGYLTAEQALPTADGFLATLRIPNHEVASVYRSAFSQFLTRSSSGGSVDAVVDAMLCGDVASFERQLGGILAQAMSYFDFGPKPVEAVYHAFVVGLLVHLDKTHLVRSNREAGHGRADVLITPRTPGPGAVLEFKVVDSDYGDTVESCLAAALAQLRKRAYADEVRGGGATHVQEYAIVFDGKRCWARQP